MATEDTCASFRNILSLRNPLTLYACSVSYDAALTQWPSILSRRELMTDCGLYISYQNETRLHGPPATQTQDLATDAYRNNCCPHSRQSSLHTSSASRPSWYTPLRLVEETEMLSLSKKSGDPSTPTGFPSESFWSDQTSNGEYNRNMH